MQNCRNALEDIKEKAFTSWTFLEEDFTYEEILKVSVGDR